MKSLISFLKMIKLEHSIFALPFAIVGMLLSIQYLNSIPNGVHWTILEDWDDILWIIVAMVGARSAAMGLNRYADAEIDARNPRTASREIPKGVITKKMTLFYIIVSFGIYFLSAYMLNFLAFVLSPIPVVVFAIYAYAKRFTTMCHFILGFALALAPVCAWIAVTGTTDGIIAPIILGIGIMFWVSGFDIIYAIQDIEYDKEEGLHSIPSILGVQGTLILAKILHLFAFIFFISIMNFTNLGYIYLSGIIISGLLMIYEHSVISKDDLSKINLAFFNMNAYISIIIMIFTIIDIIVG